MPDNVFDVLCKGIEDERYAMNAFIKLSGETTSPRLMKQFLMYAKEEMDHIITLINYCDVNFPERPLHIVDQPIPEAEDIIAFLIEYLATEESAIFFYDTLVPLVPREKDKQLFKEIGTQEKEHLVYLEAILREQTSLLNKDKQHDQ